MLTHSTYAEVAHLTDEGLTFLFFIESTEERIESYIKDPDVFFPTLFPLMQIEPKKVLRITMELDEVHRLFSEDIDEVPLMVYIHEGMLEGITTLAKIKTLVES